MSEPAWGEGSQAIVRGEETDAFRQVVLLHVRRSTSMTRCTGTYVAPRLVLTAAHCIGAGAIPAASYIYYGTGEAPPAGVMPEIPAPGERSNLALVESFRVHPDYDPALNYPDMAFVYLDRELPFKPLPLLDERVGKRLEGTRASVVGWGGSRALVPDISEVEGAGIKRVGKVTIVGSPTAADFVPEDPNPGMLDRTVRSDSLKVDGRAPRSNTCAGDSGGPLLLTKSGRTFVAGVGYWTGLSCEGYSIFARLDSADKFIGDALRGLGRAAVVPRLECVDRAENGTYTAFFGYESNNGISVEIDHSKRNVLAADRAGNRPELFAPGDHPWQFSVDYDLRDRLSYKLVGPDGRKRIVSADRRSPRCECTAACDARLAAECSPGTFSRSDCVAGCMPFAQAFPGCGTEVDAYWQCVAGLPRAAENWLCDPELIPEPVVCQEEFFAALACGGYL